MASLDEMNKIGSQVRRDIIRMTHLVNSGHPGGSLGCTEFFVALYFHIMKHDPSFNMEGHNEDLFFLSNGHISPVYYSVLARAGYFPVEELNTFRKINSRLQGHPATHEHLPGVRIASGSLGQGLSVACGAALAKRMLDDPQIVYSLHGDGELQEGQNWEAFMFAAHHNIDNIIATIDRNDAQIDGRTKEVMDLIDVGKKIESFGWHIITLEDGNNLEQVIDTLQQAKAATKKGKPVCIIMHTKMGFGVDFMHDKYQWHGKATNEEETALALNQLEETLGDY